MGEHDQGALWSYAGGQLTGEQKSAVEAHLARCAECRAALDTAQVSRKLLALAAQAPGPKLSFGPLDATLHAAAEKQLGGRARKLWSSLSLAAAGVAFAGALFLVLRPAPQPRLAVETPVVKPAIVPPALEDDSERSVVETAVGVRGAATNQVEYLLSVGEKLRAGSVLKTPAEGRAVLALPDGSRVKLAGSTEAALLTTRSELIELQVLGGTVLVKASHTAHREFVVHAGGVAVRVVGTAFSVGSRDGEVDIAVAEGKVLVEPSGGEARFLAAGEALVLEQKTTRLRALGQADRDGFAELGVDVAVAAPRKQRSPKGAVAVVTEPEALAPIPNPTPVVEAPPAPVKPALETPRLPDNAEAMFLHRAEASLKTGCKANQAALEELLDESESPAAREQARYLRARCFEEQVMSLEADMEYRKYLRDFPEGKYAAAARQAVAH